MDVTSVPKERRPIPALREEPRHVSQRMPATCAVHRRPARRPFPHDPLAQAHRGLRLPGAAHRHRPVRPADPARRWSKQDRWTSSSAASKRRGTCGPSLPAWSGRGSPLRRPPVCCRTGWKWREQGCRLTFPPVFAVATRCRGERTRLPAVQVPRFRQGGVDQRQGAAPPGRPRRSCGGSPRTTTSTRRCSSSPTYGSAASSRSPATTSTASTSK